MSRSNPAPPKYLNDFSKALAGEVRILLAEVGKLRDERRALQYEIAELMSVKSKYGAGGEYAPEWQPPRLDALPGIEGPPPPAAIEDAGPARPGWRVVHKRAPPKKRAIKDSPASPPPPPVAAIEPPRPNVPAWAQWRPNPLLAPTAVMPSGTPRPASVDRSGLFGPPTPPPK